MYMLNETQGCETACFKVQTLIISGLTYIWPIFSDCSVIFQQEGKKLYLRHVCRHSDAFHCPIETEMKCLLYCYTLKMVCCDFFPHEKSNYFSLVKEAF